MRSNHVVVQKSLEEQGNEAILERDRKYPTRDIDKKLVDAVRLRDAERVTELLAKGANPNASVPRYAVGGYESTERHPHRYENPFDSQLSYYCCRGFGVLNEEFKQFLQERTTAMHELIKRPMQKHFYRPDQEHMDLMTERFAIMSPTAKTILSSLLLAGGQFDSRNSEGQTPLHIALIEGRSGHAVIILNQAAYSKKLANAKDNDGNTPLHCLVTSFSKMVQDQFADRGECQMRLPLLKETFDLLVKHGVDVNARNKKGETVAHLNRNNSLYFASYYYNGDTTNKTTCLDFMTHMFKRGVDVNAKADNGQTLLDSLSLTFSHDHITNVYVARPDYLEFLSKAGANASQLTKLKQEGYYQDRNIPKPHSINIGSDKSPCYRMELLDHGKRTGLPVLTWQELQPKRDAALPTFHACKKHLGKDAATIIGKMVLLQDDVSWTKQIIAQKGASQAGQKSDTISK